MTRTVAIVQARCGSTRLPGKVLMELGGQPVVKRILLRLRECKSIDDIVLATTTRPDDDALALVAGGIGVQVYRGEEQDVLARYVGAARVARADVVVRITADCPMVMPDVVDTVVRGLVSGRFDFSSNAVVRSWPRGLDVEAMWGDVLYRLQRLVNDPAFVRPITGLTTQQLISANHEHVCTFIYKHRPDLFLIRKVTEKDDQSHLSWTLDTQDDYDRLTKLVARAGADNLDYRSVLATEYAFAHDEDVKK